MGKPAMSQDSGLSVPWRQGSRCLPGWDAPWVAALLVSSQAGAVIACLHLWALSCPHPDLAAACRECAREAPPWNQAMPSKLSAEASWLFCCVGLEVTPDSSFCSFGWVLGTCWPWDCPRISLFLQVPVPHPSGAQCWKGPQLSPITSPVLRTALIPTERT